MKKLTLNIVADTVVDHLGQYIKQNSRSEIECDIGHYNQVSQILLSKAKTQSIFWPF